MNGLLINCVYTYIYTSIIVVSKEILFLANYFYKYQSGSSQLSPPDNLATIINNITKPATNSTKYSCYSYPSLNNTVFHFFHSHTGFHDLNIFPINKYTLFIIVTKCIQFLIRYSVENLSSCSPFVHHSMQSPSSTTWPNSPLDSVIY